ncbi:carcinine transporter [Drosophila subobscura]|uniref:carcinine transporter n=1 Tax=Drosophila subobscura TaxID=7241 RepID=UPI00155A30FD|nr:carcinine transporter [Drosophila subobscura]
MCIRDAFAKQSKLSSWRLEQIVFKMSEKCMDFNEFLPYIGELGAYQKRLLLYMMPFAFMFALIYLAQIFMLLVPQDHWCRIQELEDFPKAKQKELGIPKDKDGVYKRCSMYDVDFKLHSNATSANESWATTKCRDGWMYDRGQVPYETISTQYNWVCQKDHYVSYAIAAGFVGSIFGCLSLGYVADHWGRIPALFLANACGLAGGLLSAACTNFYTFAAASVLQGWSYDTCFTSIYILTMETVGPQYRTLTANLSLATFYTVGACVLPWIAYACNGWRTFAVLTSVPIIILILMCLIIPESPRWLLSVGKVEKGLKIIRKIAKINGKTVPEDVLVAFQQCSEVAYHEEQLAKKYTLLDIFKSCRMGRIVLILSLNWMIIALVYDAHVRIITNVGTDIFISFSLANLAELPGGLIPLVLMDRTGRKIMLFTVLLLCSICNLLASLLTKEWDIAIAAIFGRLCVTIANNVGEQWAAEILPTVVRGQGLSLIHILGAAAAVLSPFVVYSGDYSSSLPMKILAGLAVIGAVLVLFLPETTNVALPQTIEEAETRWQQKFWFRKKKL